MLNFAEIKHCLDEIAKRPAVTKEDAPVLVLGYTGSGKSTLTNYLLGWNMQQNENGEAEPVEGSAPMQMGDSAESITLYPQLQKGFDGVLYCDCPGFEDNRSDEIRVCASVAIERIVKAAHHVAGVVVVVDYSTLVSAKGERFRELWKPSMRIFLLLNTVRHRLCMSLIKSQRKLLEITFSKN